MPQFSSSRVFEPWSLSAAVSFDAADLNAAFVESNSPTDTSIEELYYAIFSSAWNTVPLSTQLGYLAEVARLVEETNMAKGVTVNYGAPVLKNEVE